MTGRPHRALLLICAAAFLLAGCNGDADTESDAPSKATKAPTLVIERPLRGSEVSCPVLIRAKSTGLALLPFLEGADPQADNRGRVPAQLYAFVDSDAVGSGIVPTGAGVMAFERARLPLKDLAPGPHTVVVVAAGEDRTLLVPDLRAQVDFTVSRCEPPGRDKPTSTALDGG